MIHIILPLSNNLGATAKLEPHQYTVFFSQDLPCCVIYFTFPTRTLLTTDWVCLLTLSLLVFSTTSKSSLAANTLAILTGASLLMASRRDWWARVNSSSFPWKLVKMISSFFSNQCSHKPGWIYTSVTLITVKLMTKCNYFSEELTSICTCIHTLMNVCTSVLYSIYVY